MSANPPLVSFVVPCYKLAHLLRECVDSILGQTYRHLEVLIMDDCSPDDTPAVAASYTDPRVRYLRNEPNLGHLRNYQKGIDLARGELLWLISADDRLRRPYVVERFVEAFAANPGASFVFCPSVRFEDDRELDVYGAHGGENRVFRRPDFLRTLLKGNSVSAPAACARRKYYGRIGGFPLDLPFAGDWYVWARFALEGDVVYLHEPMVGYRFHALNMTKSFTSSRIQALVRDEQAVLWRLRRDAQAAGDRDSARLALEATAVDYSSRVFRRIVEDSPRGLTWDEMLSSLGRNGARSDEVRTIVREAAAAAGDAFWERRQTAQARAAYLRSLRHGMSVRTAAKLLLAAAGALGHPIRDAIIKLRHSSRSHSNPSGVM